MKKILLIITLLLQISVVKAIGFYDSSKLDYFKQFYLDIDSINGGFRLTAAYMKAIPVGSLSRAKNENYYLLGLKSGDGLSMRADATCSYFIFGLEIDLVKYGIDFNAVRDSFLKTYTLPNAFNRFNENKKTDILYIAGLLHLSYPIKTKHFYVEPLIFYGFHGFFTNFLYDMNSKIRDEHDIYNTSTKFEMTPITSNKGFGILLERDFSKYFNLQLSCKYSNARSLITYTESKTYNLTDEDIKEVRYTVAQQWNTINLSIGISTTLEQLQGKSRK